MGNPVIEAIEEQLLRRSTFRRLSQLSAGAVAEVRSDYDRHSQRCIVRYAHPSGGFIERPAPLLLQEGLSIPEPRVGDFVWVTFVGGDPSSPIVTGYAASRSSRQTSAPTLPGVSGA